VPDDASLAEIESLSHLPSGLVTDLTIEQVKAAVFTLAAERLMWARFKGLSANISITVQDGGEEHRTTTVAGTIAVTRVDLPAGQTWRGVPWKYEMALSNSAEKWRVISDGSLAGTRFVSDAASPLKDEDWFAVLALLQLPRDMLVPLYNDELFAGGSRTLSQVIQAWTPLTNRSAGNLPQSYVFRNISEPTTVFSFANGHLSSFAKAPRGKDPFEVTLGSYVKDDAAGLSYPTAITATMGQTHKVSVSLAGVALRAE
jgi:hypothetical protein